VGREPPKSSLCSIDYLHGHRLTFLWSRSWAPSTCRTLYPVRACRASLNTITATTGFESPKQSSRVLLYPQGYVGSNRRDAGGWKNRYSRAEGGDLPRKHLTGNLLSAPGTYPHTKDSPILQTNLASLPTLLHSDSPDFQLASIPSPGETRQGPFVCAGSSYVGLVQAIDPLPCLAMRVSTCCSQPEMYRCIDYLLRTIVTTQTRKASGEYFSDRTH
jgi:hypothetical protein